MMLIHVYTCVNNLVNFKMPGNLKWINLLDLDYIVGVLRYWNSN